MCGIVGILAPEPDGTEEDMIRCMMGQIAHRGPDDCGVFQSGLVSFGFQRLAILDLECGHQPMVSGDERYAIVFNGEIYNFRELREDLELNHSRQFKTQSDTEVLLQAFEVWGTDCFEKFNGMFAVAIWDVRSQTLYLARDRSGKKPLYTYATGNCLLFASEIKALRAHPAFKSDVDISRVAIGLTYRYVPGSETLFDNVNTILPGHWASVSPGNCTEIVGKPYWKYPVRQARSMRKLSVSNATSHLRELLTASVKRRMVADVPVGAFLSGGLDSSIITALMAKEASRPVNTFSIGFDTGFSEHMFARDIAACFKTVHHETIVSADDLLTEIPRVLWHRESPISEPSDIPLFMLAREARKSVTVVLSGEGSDELFAGYPKHIAEYYLSGRALTPVKAGLSAIAKFRKKDSGGSSPLALALASVSEKDKLDGLSRWFGAFGGIERNALFSPELARASASVHGIAHKLMGDYPDISPLTMMQLQDYAHWLPANLLLRGDRVTMAHSLEMRCPFLDPEIVDFALGELPDDLKIRRGTGKWLVRRVGSQLLPSHIVKRKKWGFKVPVEDWFRGPLQGALESILLSDRAANRGYFQMDEIKRLLNEHKIGANHSKQLWYLFQLELWHLMFMDGILKPTDSLI